MSKKSIIILLVFVAAALIFFVFWGIQSETSRSGSADDSGDPNSSTVYYYGKECSHCKELGDFLEKEGIAGKVPFAKKEVWHNPKNRKEMQERAESCKISGSNLAVPFVWADGKCFVGVPEAEKFFRQKAGLL